MKDSQQKFSFKLIELIILAVRNEKNINFSTILVIRDSLLYEMSMEYCAAL